MLGATQAAVLGSGSNRVWSRVYKSSSVSVSSSGLVATTSSTTNGQAIIGRAQTAFRSGAKSYFELVAAITGGVVFIGGIQSATASTVLGGSYVRFWTDDANPSPGTPTSYYLGSHLSPKAYTMSSSPVPVPNFDAGTVVSGWAVDTAAGKIWVTTDGTNWIGGGDPASGTTPTFSLDATGWVPRAENYFVSGPDGTGTATLRYSSGSFSFSRPSGF